MELVNKETIEKIKRENSIVDVAQKIGIISTIKAIGDKPIQTKCVFHEEKTPSLTLYPKTGTFYCFGCSATGDVIALVQKHLKLNFKQALKWFDSSLEINPEINFDEAKEYLKNHGINYESQQKFDFCFSKTWIGTYQYPTIKFRTPGGYKHRVFGCSGIKYRFEKGSKHTFFKTGGDPKIAIITEGEFDSIRTHQETGYSCFSPTSGNMSFSEKYVSELTGFDLIIVAFDNDLEGKAGGQKTIKILSKQIDPKKIIQIEVPEILGKDWCNYFSAGMVKKDFDELIQKYRPP